MPIEFVEEPRSLASIRVIGIGGAGGNAINRMIQGGLSGCEFIAAEFITTKFEFALFLAACAPAAAPVSTPTAEAKVGVDAPTFTPAEGRLPAPVGVVLAADEVLVAETVRRGNFKSMRQEEKTYGAESYAGEKGAKGFFVRKGKVDSWREELPVDDVAKIERAFEAEMREFGYL